MTFKSNGLFSGLILLDPFEDFTQLTIPSSLDPALPGKTFLIISQNPLALFLSLAPLSHPTPSTLEFLMLPSTLFLFFQRLVLTSFSNLNSGVQLGMPAFLTTNFPVLHDCLSSCLWVSLVGWAKDFSIEHVQNQTHLTPPHQSNLFPLLVNRVTITLTVQAVRISESSLTGV